MSTGYQLLLPDAVRQWRERTLAIRALRRDGWVEPLPHFLKAALVRREAREFRADVFVETGTFLGDMVDAMRGEVAEIHSLEVQPALYQRAVKRFAGDRSVRIVLGDSAVALPGVLASIGPDRRTLFWLDGHFSGGVTGRGRTDCPVVEELAAIGASRPSAVRILIDDFRLFGRDPAYPDPARMESLVREHLGPRATMRVANDIAVVTRDA